MKMLKSKLCGPERWGWYFRVGFPLHVCGCVVFLHRLLNFTKRRRLQDFLPCERRLSILWLLTQKNGMLKKPFSMVREGITNKQGFAESCVGKTETRKWWWRWHQQSSPRHVIRLGALNVPTLHMETPTVLIPSNAF